MATCEKCGVEGYIPTVNVFYKNPDVGFGANTYVHSNTTYTLCTDCEYEFSKRDVKKHLGNVFKKIKELLK